MRVLLASIGDSGVLRDSVLRTTVRCGVELWRGFVRFDLRSWMLEGHRWPDLQLGDASFLGRLGCCEEN